ncbi:MAG TPA: peptide chain release factor N(5)-glutamine methyltransferase [Pyrinomonadaceae bacterium]|nr:peptide chain release factor N(5)-glutamine methyltransferase [Pyrinomonadaceae bacterium]
MPTLAEKLAEAESILGASDVADARRDARLLVAAAIRRDRTFLIAHPEYQLQPAEVELVDALVRRRSANEPFQYIAGETEFYGLDFIVTPDVLIPRPETEILVENAIDILGALPSASLCEVGIGSGCIAVSILHHVPDTTATGLDVSQEALAVAQSNARRHNLAARLELRESDVFSALNEERFELIVSNPPYIPLLDLDGLQAEVRDFEPHLALFAGADGLSVIRSIVAEAPRFMTSGGYLLMEIGFGQSEAVAAMFDPRAWRSVEVLPDLQAIPRLVKARLR